MKVEIDVLTGEKVVLGADILFDCGHSLNPAVDIGQVPVTSFDSNPDSNPGPRPDPV